GYALRARETIAVPGMANVDLPAHGHQKLDLPLDLPPAFGGYAVVLDLGQEGRRLATLFVRALEPAPSSGPFPVMALDERNHTLLRRLGIRTARKEVVYRRTDATDFGQHWDRLAAQLNDLQRDGMTCMLYFQGNPPDQTALGQWAHQ